MAARDSEYKSVGFQRIVGLTRRYPSSSPALFDWFLSGRKKAPVDKWKRGARANGMVINHSKEVMGDVTETSQFIYSPFSRVSSSLSVLIVSIPKIWLMFLNVLHSRQAG